MPSSCTAYGCSNNTAKEDCIKRRVTFHKYPHARKTLMKKWLINIRRKNFVPKTYSRICSDHFKPECFLSRWEKKKTQLKIDAVPTIFSFSKLSNSSKQLLPVERSVKKKAASKKDEINDEENIDNPAESMKSTTPNSAATPTKSVKQLPINSNDNINNTAHSTKNTAKKSTSSPMKIAKQLPMKSVNNIDKSDQSTENTAETPMKLVNVDEASFSFIEKIRNENEVLRQTILNLNKKIERVRCLTGVLRSHHLISEEAATVLKCTIE